MPAEEYSSAAVNSSAPTPDPSAPTRKSATQSRKRGLPGASARLDPGIPNGRSAITASKYRPLTIASFESPSTSSSLVSTGDRPWSSTPPTTK